MKKDLKIKVHEITRVEGHGNIVIDVKKGEIKELKLEIIESPRFFEMMLRGRRYDEAQHIMSRICGICAVSHTSASLKAIESAMGINISRQATLLRKLAFDGEMLQSHILHLFFLVLPDLVGAGSIVPLLSSHPEMAKTGLELKRLANEICGVVGGRHIHPISLFPGGVLFTPKADDLKKLRDGLEASFSGLDAALEILKTKPAPNFSLEREFISLKQKGEYSFYDGEPVSSENYSFKSENYTKKIKEYVVPHSSAKHSKTANGTFMVGALARINNNFRQLKSRARAASIAGGLKPVSYNPFMNNLAQLVECYHATEDAINLIDKLLEIGPKPEPLKKPKTHGRGVGIVEAPRGTLYHEYVINKDGLIEKANCIIPTAQNLRSIEDDLRALVPTMLDRPKAEISKAVETLVRAYDPCISCSTHIMDVSFI
ncbi:MAG: Ni/Fe hydrogenase subunit alpha [Deltaproteobacteria bacterium]|nr:Ni/Fe hydrogenase subunit alpha [Deltaproteobacteria bacterium]